MNLRGAFTSLFREKKPNQDSVDPIYDSLVRLLESDRFPKSLTIHPDRVQMVWDDGLLVAARTGRWPNVTVSSGAFTKEYEYDERLVERVFGFARRVDASKDRSAITEAIHKILQ